MLATVSMAKICVAADASFSGNFSGLLSALAQHSNEFEASLTEVEKSLHSSVMFPSKKKTICKGFLNIHFIFLN